MSLSEVIWLFIQFVIGYNLLLPICIYLIWLIFVKKRSRDNPISVGEIDFAVIVTAYKQTALLPAVVKSLLNMEYQNYLVYIVADNCDISELNFTDSRIIVLRPEEILASNTRSHQYALDHFQRNHDAVTIIDSDNIVDKRYLAELNRVFSRGYKAVQGLRAAKNLDSTISCLDAARDIYYHFYDGQLLYEIGSSATLAGSGMAFSYDLYREFLVKHNVNGAGFDKVLQSWIVGQDLQIAFTHNAIVYDEKTSQTEQLVHQRSRWINTWFKYFKLGFAIVFSGTRNFSRNQFIFGFILLRPPLFIFLLLSLLCAAINLFLGAWLAAIIWILSLIIFVLSFYISLTYSNTDKRIYRSLVNIPQFIFFQLISLIKSRQANKISVATTHYVKEEEGGK
ncbi:glycosyltransferase [Pedobacter duraquae]|uniref:Cellulose synthase/poly-beta-1,6-N-acetylglucosamine synthase-like glycosyltransferase n=1 Tax=Pedobacter duraquae TaxID=425511 RepID=A0A4R6IPF7_9SPHI|nr:glycosyltransferase [Pedobacter duraquae]TDO24067.1 cellulose synthase/poly-beta-1,6-N-acetylglucosamine synthase-like glycosyltransferase [Pedobacter duraquae]